MDNDKQFALVTGASSGIGLAFSIELAKLGYPLLLVSNEEEKIIQTAEEIQNKYNVKTISLFMDLAQTNSAQKLFDYCNDNKIKIIILINNAGIFFFRDIINTTPSLMETMINLHVTTPVMLCRLFAEQMFHENRKGYFLNVASISAWMMMPGISLYSSTKTFIRGFSRAMNREIRDWNCSITTVCPGAAATGLYNLPLRYTKLGIRLGIIIPVQRLAILALKKMFRRKAEFIPGGFVNRLFIFMVKSLPECMIRLIRKKIKTYNTIRGSRGGAELTECTEE